MKMTSDRRAIDKVFRRRDRYDIPDRQRQEVWNREKKQRLIDSILRGWKLPKFYFIEASGDNYLVEDGQQRLNAIWEFFSNELPLSAETEKQFGARLYRELPRRISDSFDDFENLRHHLRGNGRRAEGILPAPSGGYAANQQRKAERCPEQADQLLSVRGQPPVLQAHCESRIRATHISISWRRWQRLRSRGWMLASASTT